MNQQPDYEALYGGIAALFDAPWLKTCQFSQEFCERWRRTLRAAARENRALPPKDPNAVLAVPHTFREVALTLHFDQQKMWDWFLQDSRLPQHRIFVPCKLTRNSEGCLGVGDSTCCYDAAAPEPAVPPQGKEIFAAPLPGLPPSLRVVYGNARVEQNFHGFRNRTLSVYLVQAEFVPAFLCNTFEMCAYLFWMDCCILSANRIKVRDKDLKPLLHIFRESSVLTLNHLLR